MKIRGFRDLIDMFENNDMQKVVKKTVPMKKEWKTKMEEMDKATEEAKNSDGRMEALKHSFWSTVELDLQDFSEMRINRKTQEIEILEEIDRKAVPSPFQM